MELPYEDEFCIGLLRPVFCRGCYTLQVFVYHECSVFSISPFVCVCTQRYNFLISRVSRCFKFQHQLVPLSGLDKRQMDGQTDGRRFINPESHTGQQYVFWDPRSISVGVASRRTSLIYTRTSMVRNNIEPWTKFTAYMKPKIDIFKCNPKFLYY